MMKELKIDDRFAARCETCGWKHENQMYSTSGADVDFHRFYNSGHRVYNYDMDNPRTWNDIYPENHPASIHSKGSFYFLKHEKGNDRK